MDDVLPLLVLTAALAAVMGFFTWLAHLVRRRGLAGTAIRDALAAYEEAWHVSGYEAHREVQAQGERTVPIPAPDDPGATRPHLTGEVAVRPHRTAGPPSHPRRRLRHLISNRLLPHRH
ncbi:hypothetical protein [Kineococcus vitellinus]|uniref:hypothetical protein n=1 Tax=Kineococcus vitellinus TaxID=2696565 RepID=UPI00196BA2E1|nr:hypothetical protein [Kineococcus vitellinus]